MTNYRKISNHVIDPQSESMGSQDWRARYFSANKIIRIKQIPNLTLRRLDPAVIGRVTTLYNVAICFSRIGKKTVAVNIPKRDKDPSSSEF